MRRVLEATYRFASLAFRRSGRLAPLRALAPASPSSDHHRMPVRTPLALAVFASLSTLMLGTLSAWTRSTLPPAAHGSSSVFVVGPDTARARVEVWRDQMPRVEAPRCGAPESVHPWHLVVTLDRGRVPAASIPDPESLWIANPEA